MKAVEQHLERQEIEAKAGYASDKISPRVHYLLRDSQPTVSIIIPTRDRVELLQPCVQSVLEKTAYSNFELHCDRQWKPRARDAGLSWLDCGRARDTGFTSGRRV